MEIKNGNICIRHATINDAKILCKWWNNLEIMNYAGFPNGWNITEEEIKSMISKETDETTGRWIIEIDGEPCGEMIYENKDDNIVQIGVKMCDIGKREKGYGARALKMFMNYLLEIME